MGPVAAIELLDGLIVLAYVVGVVWLGVVHQRRQKTTADYLLGSRRIPWWAIGISLIATSFSSLSLIGGTDNGYSSNFLWWQLQIGDLLAMLVVCAVFLPFFAKLQLTTAYEYLEHRFGRRARWLASAMFHFTVLLRAGPILAATALVGARVIGTEEVALCIVVVGLAAMVYSSLGGLGAVVWTDLVQMVLVIGGVGACLVLAIGDLPGGMADVVAAMDRSGAAAGFDTSLDPARFPTVLSSALAYGILALSVFGTNQQSVQRYLACEDVRAARRAGLLAWAVGAVVVLLTMSLGVALNAWYQGAPLPEGSGVLGAFISDRVPIGLTGVLAAAILAASMSSMDSAIHAMATATLVDFVEPLRRRPMDEARRLRTARALTWVYGAVLIGVALIAHGQLRSGVVANENVMTLVVRWLGYAAGPILGLFLLAICTRRVREMHAIIGTVAGILAALALNWVEIGAAGTPLIRALGLHPLWTCALTALATFGVGLVVSLGGARSPGEHAGP